MPLTDKIQYEQKEISIKTKTDYFRNFLTSENNTLSPLRALAATGDNLSKFSISVTPQARQGPETKVMFSFGLNQFSNLRSAHLWQVCRDSGWLARPGGWGCRLEDPPSSGWCVVTSSCWGYPPESPSSHNCLSLNIWVQGSTVTMFGLELCRSRPSRYY